MVRSATGYALAGGVQSVKGVTTFTQLHYFFIFQNLEELTGFFLEKLGWEGNRMYTSIY